MAKKGGRSAAGGELRYEPYPLISAEQKRAAKTKPITLAVALTPGAHVDGDALVLAWLPGGLKPPGPGVARCERALAQFDRAFESAAIAGEAWLPRELGLAAAELSEWPDFKARLSHPAREWSFLQFNPGGSSAGRSSAPKDELGGRLEPGIAAVEGWARERLGAFALRVEPMYFSQMSADPQAMDARLARELSALAESEELGRSLKGLGAGAVVKAGRRAL